MKNNLPYEDSVSTSDAKLTSWKQEPDVLALKDDLQLAKPAHDKHVAKVKSWLDLRNIDGTAKPKSGKNRSKVQPKLVRRQSEWRYSSLSEPFLSADNLFDVSPSTWEDHDGSIQNRMVLEWQFNTKLNRVKFIDEYVRTTVDEGTVIVKLGWDRQTKKVNTEVPVWEYSVTDDATYAEIYQQAYVMKQENPNGFLDLPASLQEAVEYALEKGTQYPVFARQAGTEIVQEEKVIRNQPTLDILHYENIYLDPTCNGDIEKANFAVISFETSKAELIKDGRYKNLDKVNWSSNSPLHTPEHATNTDESQQFKDTLRKKVVAYEYWGFFDVHGDNSLVPIVATWIGDTMIRMEENPFPDQSLPLVIVSYLPVRKSITGEPDAELLEENQAILGAITRGMIDLMGRSANGQTGFAKGMLDPVNKRRYDSGQDYEYNPNFRPNEAITQHKYPDIPNSALTMLQLQNQEAEAISGVKAFAGGLSGEAYGEVAAGIRGMLDASAKREMNILRRLAQGMENIGRKLITMNQVFLSEEEVVRVTNKQFVRIRREDLRGEYDLEVDISTAEIEEAKAQDLAFMLQTMGNTLDFDMTKLILAEIARLKRMPKLAKMIEQFQPQPDPLDQRIKEAEARKLELEVVELESKANLNNAKARKEMSDADLKDLDFVEQETGTKHAREMDKQGAQAAGNRKLEITKRLITPDSDGTKKQDIRQALSYEEYLENLDNVA